MPKKERMARNAEKFFVKPVPRENAAMMSRFAMSGHFLFYPFTLVSIAPHHEVAIKLTCHIDH